MQGIVFVQELGKDVIELNQENTNMSGASIILTMISYFDGKEIASAMIPLHLLIYHSRNQDQILNILH